MCGGVLWLGIAQRCSESFGVTALRADETRRASPTLSWGPCMLLAYVMAEHGGTRREGSCNIRGDRLAGADHRGHLDCCLCVGLLSNSLTTLCYFWRGDKARWGRGEWRVCVCACVYLLCGLVCMIGHKCVVILRDHG